MARYSTRRRTETLQNKTLDSTCVSAGMTQSASVAAASGVVGQTTVTLTKAQVIALRATPITLVAGQTGKVLQLLQGAMFLKYGGTNVFTESTNNLQVKYVDGSGAAASEVIETTGFIDQSADTCTVFGPVTANATLDNTIIATATASGAALVLHNTSGSEIAGNAGADNTVVVKINFVAWPAP